MSKDTMTPRERWLAVLARRTPDRIPMDHWSTWEAALILMKHLGCADVPAMYARLHIDHPFVANPRYAGPAIPAGSDVFGCGFTDVSYGAGVYRECTHHPLAGCRSVTEIEKTYRWPDPDWWDYSGIAAAVCENESLPVQGGGVEVMPTYGNLRGYEQAMADFAENPEIVHHCLDRLFALASTNTLRIFEAIPGRVEISWVCEDMGAQNSLLFSLATIREFLLPRMKRVIDLAHQAGARVFHHNDGAICEAIPDLIEAGIDILNPIQWRARGMDRNSLKRKYGEALVFHGAMDNQETLPFGSIEDVRAEVEENIRILGKGGGYILAPCQGFQTDSPPENVVAMYDAGYEMGRR
jgi:uroporphyrinogen decarboxylase